MLGHYVGDAHVPLHAVLNYDGQLTGQTGVHARWESDLVDRFLRQLEPRVEPGQRHGRGPARRRSSSRRCSSRSAKPRRHSSPTARSRASGTSPTPRRTIATATPTFRALRTRAAAARGRASARAAERLGSLWLSAFEEAGRPPLDPAFRFPYVRGARGSSWRASTGRPHPWWRTRWREASCRTSPRSDAQAPSPRVPSRRCPPKPRRATPPSSPAPGPTRTA